ncbi:MAG: rRNA methyltransferase, partial [Alphaproteobacteria bacterium]|nr:rRNA methyltransferase [Alphaproteobacteria bacterium]
IKSYLINSKVENTTFTINSDEARLVIENAKDSTFEDKKSNGLENAYEFAKEVLAKGGIFIAKVFQGGAEGALLADAKKNFLKVGHFKPDASRSTSPETYLVCQGYKGNE